jgi:hypothetical protein
VELDGKALLAYREAVYAGNFMAMRRAAYAPGTVEDSAKLRRLVEIADEATADGRKVVVFSFFRDVLDTVADTLGPKAVGPLTGSVPPSARQAMVDEFTTRTGPSVLVSQIHAGGVGLNIQAASVVIIAEPQWTPAIEEQAIARCHRMGQVRRVDVHRLLTEDSVDQRMLEILRVKADEFNEYAPSLTSPRRRRQPPGPRTSAASSRWSESACAWRKRGGMARYGWPSCAAVGRVRFPSPLFQTNAASSDCEKADSRGLEDRVEMPFEKLAVRPVGLPIRQCDHLPCFRVELLTVAELVP